MLYSGPVYLQIELPHLVNLCCSRSLFVCLFVCCCCCFFLGRGETERRRKTESHFAEIENHAYYPISANMQKLSAERSGSDPSVVMAKNSQRADASWVMLFTHSLGDFLAGLVHLALACASLECLPRNSDQHGDAQTAEKRGINKPCLLSLSLTPSHPTPPASSPPVKGSHRWEARSLSFFYFFKEFFYRLFCPF